MSRVVLDTNVLASGLLEFEHPTRAPGQLLALWREQAFDLIVSDPILVEVARTLTRPYFRARLTQNQVERYLLLLERYAIKTPITVVVHAVASHPEDDVILATAVSAEVDYLATGDHGLQALSSYRGVRLLSPRALLTVLQPA